MEISGRGRAAELAKMLLGVQEVGPVSGKSPSKPQGQEDRVQISDQAKELQRIKDLTHVPDHERMKKIEQIRQSLESGTYGIESRKVGDSILRQVLTDTVL
ncbi:Anti-sigma 28 factor FlgM [Nitrospira sp. KM1]|uniref:flagellar biosynthesis anti-sigma factor FlgM n=1 Tax=Nitrospira sp. KM1 TaxID=1936990 RepID=UPI0013A72457|nr:flagellar biosynthesis anti-sigma factor FlgM [Nitrospira sp. KM1]BCA54790.1 Anti-sigma 28 factor FlgM [Nitrospira sp. KM1]